MISLLCAGIDYPAAYLALLRGQACGPQRPADAVGRVQIEVLPFALLQAAMRGSRRELSARLAAFMTMCRPGPGRRYGAILLAKTLTLLAQRGLRSLSRHGSEL